MAPGEFVTCPEPVRSTLYICATTKARLSASGSSIGNPTDGFLAVVPSVWEDDENGEDLKGGLGMQYLHDSNLALRGEFEYFDVDGTDNVWLISFAAIWRFD